MRNTKVALTWIVGILNKEDIPFEIDGGLAAHFYGSTRELADIDINVSKESFEKLSQLVREHVTFGPTYYKDENWNLNLMSLNYAGQNIDISQLGSIRYFDKETGIWVDFPESLEDARIFDYEGMKLPVVNEIKLLISKKQLGRGVDRKDIGAMLVQLLNQWFGKKK